MGRTGVCVCENVSEKKKNKVFEQEGERNDLPEGGEEKEGVKGCRSVCEHV